MPVDDSELALHVELVTDEPLVLRFTVAGELDLAGAEHLSHAVDSVPADAEVVLNLSQVDFIDTSGLRVLIACRLERTMAVEDPSAAVVRLCELAEVAHLLEPPVSVRPVDVESSAAHTV